MDAVHVYVGCHAIGNTWWAREAESASGVIWVDWHGSSRGKFEQGMRFLVIHGPLPLETREWYRADGRCLCEWGSGSQAEPIRDPNTQKFFTRDELMGRGQMPGQSDI